MKNQTVAPDDLKIGKANYELDFTSLKKSEVIESNKYFGEGKIFQYANGYARYTRAMWKD